MSSILLLNPNNTPDNVSEHRPHLGLLSIATVLDRGGYPVKVTNILPDRKSFNELKMELKKDVIFVGISAMTPQVGFALEISRFIKEQNEKIFVVWGGVHGTLYPEQTVNNPLVDIVAIGEGEDTCVELAVEITRKGDLGNVPGIGFKRGNEFIRTPFRPYRDINDIPPLNYDLVDVNSFIWQNFSVVNGPSKCRSLTVVASRGCAYKCTFCINNIVLKNGFRFKRADLILNEIEYLIEKYGIDHMGFGGEEFFSPQNRLLELLDGIEKRGIKIAWTAPLRAHHFRPDYINLDLAKRIRKSGCYFLDMGVESSSERILKKLKKGITIEQVKNAYETCREADITLGSSYIIGLPTELKNETHETVKLAYDLWRKDPKRRKPIIVSIFRPYPGSELYDEVIKTGFKEIESLEEWGNEEFYETNFQDINKFPWIADPVYIRLVSFTCRNVFVIHKRAFGWIPWEKVLSRIGAFRVEHDFWKFPFEMALFERIRTMLNIYRKVMLNLKHPISMKVI